MKLNEHIYFKQHGSWIQQGFLHCPHQAALMMPTILQKLHGVPGCTKLILQNNHEKEPKHITRCDVRVLGQEITVTFRWMKTIQYEERRLQVPMVSIPGSDLCPVKGYTNSGSSNSSTHT